MRPASSKSVTLLGSNWRSPPATRQKTPPVARALHIRPSRWDRETRWEVKATVPYMARALSLSGARSVTPGPPLDPLRWTMTMPPSLHPLYPDLFPLHEARLLSGRAHRPPQLLPHLLPPPDVTSSACHPNMAEGRDGVQCRGL